MKRADTGKIVGAALLSLSLAVVMPSQTFAQTGGENTTTRVEQDEDSDWEWIGLLGLLGLLGLRKRDRHDRHDHHTPTR